jgi:hypothetical protein
MIFAKWMYENNTYPLMYERHPDTGNRGYQSAYLWVSSMKTDIQMIRLFESHGWTYLRKEKGRLVFVKERE